MASKSFLDIWNIQTLLPVKALETIAVRAWVRHLSKESGLTPYKLGLVYLENKATGAKTGSMQSWDEKGSPVPPLFRIDGSPGALQIFEKEFPGSFRTMVHPGWVLLSGPLTLAACHSLMEQLDVEVFVHFNFHRFNQIPGFEISPEFAVNAIESDILYFDKFVAAFKKIGTMDAFFGAIGLYIDLSLNTAFNFPKNHPFPFDPDEWAFCNNLEPKLHRILSDRLEDLRAAYFAFTSRALPLQDVAYNFAQFKKFDPALTKNSTICELLKIALRPDYSALQNF